MAIKTDVNLRPAQCRCDKTGKMLSRYALTLSVTGLTIEEAAALLPQVKASVDGMIPVADDGDQATNS